MSLAGKKCQVCIGCGKCDDDYVEMQVVADSFLLRKFTATALDVNEPFMCVDLGTTTIAMEMFDFRGTIVDNYSAINPQRIFGKDVLSRVAAAENRACLLQMKALIRKELSKGIKYFKDNGYHPKRVYIAGNTTMMYLLMGYNTASLGAAPFRAEYIDSEFFEMDGLEIHTIPGFSAFVGGDIMAGAMALFVEREPVPTLLVDLGTNGELYLSVGNKAYATATAAGSAFEGSDGSFACDRIRRVASLMDKGYIDEFGALSEEYRKEGIVVGNLLVTQDMIQAMLMAKAAIRSGIDLLLQKAGLHPKQIGKVYLAGGFGYFLDVKSAVRIGLFPRDLEDKVRSVGNSSLAGAYRFAVDKNAGAVVQYIRKKTEIINLALEDEFSERFFSNMTL